jgi:hypothetical protein
VFWISINQCRSFSHQHPRYTRDFNLDKNTHLIAAAPQGAKYELALSNPSIHIVAPSWLFSSLQSRRRVSENEHGLLQAIGPQNTTSYVSRNNTLTILENLLRETQNESTRFLFECHQFYLLGFDGHDITLKQNIGGLIRRCMGTIYWDLNEDINIIVLCDNCDEALYSAASVVSSHHANLPQVVSPLWVIKSYESNRLQPAGLYPPIRSPLFQGESRKRKATPSGSSATSTFSVFRGCLFSLVRTTPCDGDDSTMDFDPKEQEAFIRAHGGQILSSNLLQALRADAQSTSLAGDDDGGAMRQVSARRRACHVVCWGGPPRLETNSLVAQLKQNNLCEVIPVSPIWIQTCVSMKKFVRPERVPSVFVPPTWPMRSINHKRCIGKGHEPPTIPLHVSLTGFQGAEKMALIHLIGAMGGLYHDNMSNNNTHLICKEKATGLKLEKAIQWGLHVVSIEWLYHVLRHGYGGIHGDKAGCEARFSVT